MKVSELQDAELDYWVAKAEAEQDGFVRFYLGMGAAQPFKYSNRWELAGPIIERERITVQALHNMAGQHVGWSAKAREWAREGEGPTPIIAAMRAFCASRFGEEVPDQESQ